MVWPFSRRCQNRSDVIKDDIAKEGGEEMREKAIQEYDDNMAKQKRGSMYYKIVSVVGEDR